MSAESGGDPGNGSTGESCEAPMVETVNIPTEHVVYNCRMCRRALFDTGDIENHEVAQHNFRRRKSKGVTSNGLCSSIFLAEPKRWMKQQAGEMEGKLSCPNRACGARLGSLKWTGAQCSCGSWITPAIQFPRKNLDARSRVAAGPPPGTVVHPSLRFSGGAAAGPPPGTVVRPSLLPPDVATAATTTSTQTGANSGKDACGATSSGGGGGGGKDDGGGGSVEEAGKQEDEEAEEEQRGRRT